MNSSPNRERVLRECAHCAQCNPYVWRVVGGRMRRDYSLRHRIGNPHHGQVKLRGIHAHRKGMS